MRDHPVDTLTLVYLARLREAFGASTETVRIPPEVSTVARLREWLEGRGGVWAAELAPSRAVRVAVNQEIVQPSASVQSGDEVAFFPPVTGG